jgi:excisionase family DNA binding protein
MLKMEENNQLLNLQEAAKKLGVKPVTLRKWDNEGKLMAVRVGSRGDRKYKEEKLKEFLEKSKKKKLEWQEYIRSGTTYHHICPAIKAARVGMKKYFGLGLTYHMSYFEANALYWYYEREDLYGLGKTIMDKLTKSKNFETEFFETWNKKSKEVLDFVEEHSKEELNQLSKPKLVQIYNKLSELMYEWYSISMCIDPTDEFLMIDITKKIKEIIRSKLGENYSEKEFIRVYNIITTPSKPSYLNDERKMILEIVRDLNQRTLKQASNEFDERINKILNLFWWTALGWAREEPKNKFNIINEIDNIRNSKIDVKKELEKMECYAEQTESSKEEVEKKYSFDNEKQLKALLRILDRFFFYHDSRKEIQMKYNFFEYKLLEEIAKQTNVHPLLLDWCTPEEVLELINHGKFNEEEINKRTSHFFYTDLDGSITMLGDKAAEKEHKKKLEFNLEETKDLQGLSACSGKATGRAMVAVTIGSALKIKQGEILITGMTTPDFVPAMKKAAAIVTDEGGITCHAAIVSREMNKPCIVGTKSSTKIIETGDLVEVDGNHGVIRILEKAK